MMHMKQLVIILLFLILCIATLFVTTNIFVNPWITAKWYGFIFGTIALSIALIFLHSKHISTQSACILSFIVTILCSAQAITGILQYAHIIYGNNGFQMTGSFDNPAGLAACICAGLPFALCGVFQKESIWLRIAALTAYIICSVSVILSLSRAGIISIITIAICCMSNKIKLPNRIKLFLCIAILSIALLGLYFLKPDSANGRMLIWRCTWEMIKDKPLFGFDYGGFTANYMNYQAQYFTQHHDSLYAQLADNTTHPFNEYLLLLTNFGIIGMLIFIALVLFVYHSYRRNKNRSMLVRCALWCIIATGVFALFSYPLRYPFVLVMVITSITIILQDAGYQIRMPAKSIIALKSIALLIIVLCCIVACTRMRIEMLWCKIAHKSLTGNTKQMIPKYKYLYKKLKHHPLFLYNYAAELNSIHYYEASLMIATECQNIMADYHLQMILADDYQNIGDHIRAIRCLKRAAAMCPNRFIPLYQLAKLYKSIGYTSQAQDIAQQIINKHVKIPSSTVSSIKQEMQQLLTAQPDSVLWTDTAQSSVDNHNSVGSSRSSIRPSMQVHKMDDVRPP